MSKASRSVFEMCFNLSLFVPGWFWWMESDAHRFDSPYTAIYIQRVVTVRSTEIRNCRITIIIDGNQLLIKHQCISIKKGKKVPALKRKRILLVKNVMSPG